MDNNEYMNLTEQIVSLELQLNELRGRRGQMAVKAHPEWVEEAADAILRALRRHGPMKRKALKASLSSKHRPTSIYSPALDALVALQAIALVDGVYSLAGTPRVLPCPPGEGRE